MTLRIPYINNILRLTYHLRPRFVFGRVLHREVTRDTKAPNCLQSIMFIQAWEVKRSGCIIGNLKTYKTARGNTKRTPQRS